MDIKGWFTNPTPKVTSVLEAEKNLQMQSFEPYLGLQAKAETAKLNLLLFYLIQRIILSMFLVMVLLQKATHFSIIVV